MISISSKIMKPIKMVLIDLSGTLHIDDIAISGAVQALKRLRESGIALKFVTNTSKESGNFLYHRLMKLGFNINKQEIFSSLVAAKQLIVSQQLNPMLLIDEAAMEDFADVGGDDKALDAVLVGLAPEKFNYNELNKAFRLLLDGASLIAIHEGRYYKKADGLALGPGAFIKGLEYSTGVKAKVVGKPTASFFKSALHDMSPENAIMIGDDVKDDIAGSQAVGIRGILVQTGKYRPGDEHTISPSPWKVVPSFVEAVEAIIQESI